MEHVLYIVRGVMWFYASNTINLYILTQKIVENKEAYVVLNDS